MVNPSPTTYRASGTFLARGANLYGVTEEMLCPVPGSTGEPIYLTSGPFSWSGVEADIFVPGGLVSGGVYHVRVVARGIVSAESPLDRLFVAIAPGGATLE